MERHFDMAPFYVPSVISSDATTENTFQFNPTSKAPPSTGCPDRDIRKLIAVCIRAWKARDAYGTMISPWRYLKDILLHNKNRLLPI